MLATRLCRTAQTVAFRRHDSASGIVVSSSKIFTKNGHENCGVVSVCADVRQRRAYSMASFSQDIMDSELVQKAGHILINIHDTLGLPWWCSIIISTITLRTVTTLPLAIYSQHILARLENLGPEVAELNRLLKIQTATLKHKSNITEKQAMAIYKYSLKKRVQELIERENCHPSKATVTVFAQFPLWISLSLAMRDLADKSLNGIYALQSLQHEGLLQISNLALPDPTFIVPVCVFLVNAINIELYPMRSSKPKVGWSRALHNVFRTINVLVLPVAVFAPSGLTLYWLTSALAALAQNLSLMSPRVRRLCRIPLTEKEVQQPYTILAENLRQTFSLAKFRRDKK